MNQEKKAKIAVAIKPILKKYGVKGSLSVYNGSTIVLTVKSGSIDFVKNYIDTDRNKLSAKKMDDKYIAYVQKNQYLDINPYWYEEHFNGSAKEFLEESFKALKSVNWYNNTDIQSDYFDIAYYVDVKIGKWDKPYVVTN